jgi:hypothetical protein
MIAAELFSYSYPNYSDHLGIGNARFEEIMPREVDLLENAERENWEPARIAEAVDLPVDEIPGWVSKFREAREIVDAPSLAKSFRRAVRQAVEGAVSEGLADRASVERLVTQICYRAADLAYRLDAVGQRLSHYSEELREETEYDEQYWHEVLRQEAERRSPRSKGAG